MEDSRETAAKSLPADEFEVSEAQVDQAVAACGGDLRATVRALIVGQVSARDDPQEGVSGV